MLKQFKNLLVVTMSLATVGIAGNVLAYDYTTANNQFSSIDNSKNETTFIKADRRLKSDRLIKKLNLDTSQQQQMRAIRDKYQPQMQSLKDNIRSERQKLSSMMQSNASPSTLRSQHEKIVDLGKQVQNLGFESMLEMRQVLTSEQRQQWAESMAELRANRRDGLR